MSKLPALKRGAVPPATPPKTPKTPGRKGPNTADGKGGAGASKTSARVNTGAILLEAEEERARDTVEQEYSIAYMYLSTEYSLIPLVRQVQHQQEQQRGSLQENNAMMDTMVKKSTEQELSLLSLKQETEEIRRMLFNNWTKEQQDQAHRLTVAEQEVVLTKRQLDSATLEVEKLRSENESLRETLKTKLMRNVQEEEKLRGEVRQEVERLTMDWKVHINSLHQRVDEAVLNYHRPQFESNLASLKETAENIRRVVEQQTDRLHLVIDCIGAEDDLVTRNAKTMHSNLSAVYRTELQKFSKEQLLNLVDVLSFELNVPAVVGRAIFNTDPTRTQVVFK